jgi:hypothetical protein
MPPPRLVKEILSSTAVTDCDEKLAQSNINLYLCIITYTCDAVLVFWSLHSNQLMFYYAFIPHTLYYPIINLATKM